MKRKQGGSDEGAQRCPPHPAFVLGRCFLCGVKEKDAEGGAPGVAVWHEALKQGGDGEEASARCPPHHGFVHGLCSRCGAEEEKAGGGAPGVAVGLETMNPGVDGGGDDDGDSACFPPHPEIVQSIGYRCGATEEGASGVTVANIDSAARVQAASSAAKNMASASDMETFECERKLILVLVLDHTLLNSTGLDGLSFSPAEQAKGFTPDMSGDARIGLSRVDSDKLGMFVKLRPFAQGFLEQASSMFEMHVCTVGNQVYAKAAIDLLDPNGVFFGGRVVSIHGGTKSLDVIPGADPVAAVILDALDDTDIDWVKHQDNLILTDRYRYFVSTYRKAGDDFIPSLAEQGLDEMEDDGSLAVALGVLKRVHKAFFDGHRTDVREVIRELRRQVLSGCTVVFSYLEEDMEYYPQLSLMWTLAQRLGAVCKKDVDETVTHVAAEDPGTQKAQWAREHGKFLVNLEWINTAGVRLCRLDEQGFPVTAMGVERRHAVEDPILHYAALGLTRLKQWYQEKHDHED